MRRPLVLVMIFTLLFVNKLFSMTYKEDNAAYWYSKAFQEFSQAIPANESNKIENITSLDDYNKLSPENKKIIADNFHSFVNNIKTAKSKKQCIFWEKAQNDQELETKGFTEAKLYMHGFRLTNTMAWHAISINKPDLAGALWQTILSIASEVSEHNLLMIRYVSACIGIKIVTNNLTNYFKSGATPEFKAKFCHYLKNKWPKSIFDIKDVLTTQYTYWKTNLDYLSKNQKALAVYFGAQATPDKPVLVENKICKSHLRVITAGIEMYCLDNEKASFSDYDNMMSELLKQRYIRANEDYSCPVGGKRTLKHSVVNGEDIYEVICSCTTVQTKDDFAEDSKPMQLAKQFRATLFEKERNDILKNFETLLYLDHSKPLTPEIQKYSDDLMNKSIENTVLPAYALCHYYRTREPLDEHRNLIENFIKTYDK